MSLAERREGGVGERIKRARKAAGLSQADLAARASVSQPTVANWELGAHDPRRPVLEKVADALGVTCQWLNHGDEDAATIAVEAAEYFRTPIVHVPVIDWMQALAFEGRGEPEPMASAGRYISFATARADLFALAVSDAAVDREFPTDCLVVVDYGDRVLVDGGFFLFRFETGAVLRRWRSAPARLEPCSNDPAFEATYLTQDLSVLGRIIASFKSYS
ncbi:MAG: helix-turn-helix transcriptional regulator [Pseudomonadota bacterium]